MTHKDAPPETPSQTACREWWAKNQPHVFRAWGRSKRGEFLAEESLMLHRAWVAAFDAGVQAGHANIADALYPRNRP